MTTEIVIRLQLELPPGMSLMATPVPDEPLVYRLPVVAGKLGVSPSKVSELVARGELESVKLDGSRGVTPDDLRAYVAKLPRGTSDRTAGDGSPKPSPATTHDSAQNGSSHAQRTTGHRRSA